MKSRSVLLTVIITLIISVVASIDARVASADTVTYIQPKSASFGSLTVYSNIKRVQGTNHVTYRGEASCFNAADAWYRQFRVRVILIVSDPVTTTFNFSDWNTQVGVSPAVVARAHTSPIGGNLVSWNAIAECEYFKGGAWLPGPRT